MSRIFLSIVLSLMVPLCLSGAVALEQEQLEQEQSTQERSAQSAPQPRWTILVTPEQKNRLEPTQALAAVNAYRAAHGSAPLRLEPKLMVAALSYAEDLARKDLISHRGSGGALLATWLRENNYDPYRAAENLSGGQRDFDEAFAAWVGSAHHRENLLDPDLQELGIAVVYRPDSQYRTFWVMILATPF